MHTFEFMNSIKASMQAKLRFFFTLYIHIYINLQTVIHALTGLWSDDLE